ncbi:MAG: AMP-binding protein [Caulobacteraceae bacterium]
MSLPLLLRRRAEESADRIFAQDIAGRSLSYADAVSEMERWSGAWTGAGIASEDLVVTMQSNSLESMSGWLGLTSIGAVEAPINTDYRGDLLIHALNLTRARAMLVDAQYIPRLAEVAERLEHLRLVIIVGEPASAPPIAFETVLQDELVFGAKGEGFTAPAMWDIAAILFTSGTTGSSKAVRMPWGQLYATAVGTMPLADLGPHDVFFNAGPTYHLGAKVFPYLAALTGGRHVVRPFPSLAKQPEEYRRHGVTTCYFPPMQWLEEPEHPEDADCALRNLLLPLPIPRIDEFKRRFGCRTYSVYSMTELSCPISDLDWDIGRINGEGLFSCGVVRRGWPGYEARIVDENDQEVVPGVVGELIVRTSVPWTTNAGYLNNPEATAEAWRNGWFHTGDAFSRDEDGYFYFRDRIKDCIRRRAENISSFEVEVYARGHPDVADCAAVAYKLSPELGADEEVRLFVVAGAETELSPDELARWLIPRMPRFMHPRFIEFVEELPQTPTLKVQKALLRARPLSPSGWDRERVGLHLPR